MMRPKTPLPERNFPVPKRPRKPYIAPREGGGKSMTIVAGFRCLDGIVLCADSQFTIPGALKYPESKIRMAESLKSQPFFTFCGDMDYSKQAISHFGKALGKAERDRTDLVSALEAEAADLHLKYYDMYSEPTDKLNLDMLVSLLLGNQRHLFKIYGPKVIAVEDFQCLGAGSYLARALAGTYWQPGASIHRTAIVCAYILSDVKKYVDGCGGDSQIICLYDDGSWTLFPDDGMFFTIEEIEKHYQEWKDQVRELAVHYSDFKVYQYEFESAMADAAGYLLNLRSKSAEWYSDIERIKFEQALVDIKQKRAGQKDEP